MRFVHSKLSFITSIQNINIMPGMNTLSDAEFNLIADNRIFKEEVTSGRLFIGGSPQSETSLAIDKAGDMKSRGYEIAKEIASINKLEEVKEAILKINDTHILKAILGSDGRKGVQEAVEARLSSIKGQEGADLKPESKEAPDGDGSDFDADIVGSKQDMEGGDVKTAIPALKTKKKKR